MDKKENYKTEKGYNMCQALREIMDESREEGEKKGIHALIQENRDEGTSEERIIQKLQKYFDLSMEQALGYLKE